MDFSDHFINIFILPKVTTKKDYTNRPSYRQFSTENKIKFHNLLKSINWSAINYINSVDEAFESFTTNLHNAFNSCFPLTEMSRCQYRNKARITPSLKQSILYKNSLYRCWMRTKNSDVFKEYTCYKSLLTKLIRKPK